MKMTELAKSLFQTWLLFGAMYLVIFGIICAGIGIDRWLVKRIRENTFQNYSTGWTHSGGGVWKKTGAK